MSAAPVPRRELGGGRVADALPGLASGIALALLTLLTKWYGAAGRSVSPFAASPTLALGPWHALTIVRWLLLACAAAGIGCGIVCLIAGRAPAVVRGTALVLGSATTLALLYRVLIDPPLPAAVDDVKLGGYLALIAAAGVAATALPRTRAVRRSPAVGR